jgi:hypothetical protein
MENEAEIKITMADTLAEAIVHLSTCQNVQEKLEESLECLQ